MLATVLCLGSGLLEAQEVAPASTPPSPVSPASTGAADHAASDSYVLRDNDLVRLTVFQEDDMTTETRVSKSGYITLPLLGAVEVAGKSVADATNEIRTRLDKDYIINPQVTLTVMEYAQQWVTVLGEVQKPGQVQIPPEGGLDLLGAIALAGGYTRVADPFRRHRAPRDQRPRCRGAGRCQAPRPRYARSRNSWCSRATGSASGKVSFKVMTTTPSSSADALWLGPLAAFHRPGAAPPRPVPCLFRRS